MVTILLVKNVLLAFQMEQNGMFLDNYEYDDWILSKKLVWDEIFNIFHKITHISFNTYWLRNVKSPYSGAPFPLGWSLISLHLPFKVLEKIKYLWNYAEMNQGNVV